MRTTPGNPDDTQISAGAESDPTAEDWLAEEGDLDWGEVEWPVEPGVSRRRDGGKSRSAGRSRLGRTGRSPSAAEGLGQARSGESPLDRFLGGGWQGDVVMRRRIAGIAALVAVVVVAIVVALIASGGGKKSGSPSTTQLGGGSPTVTTPSATTPTTPTKTHTTPPSAVSPIVLPPGGSLSTGDKGAVVAQLQKALAALGYHPGKADGIFGPGTNAAVAAFQKKRGLKADGVVGPKTVRQINAALAALNATG